MSESQKGLITASGLLQKTFTAQEWILQNLIPSSGLGVLAGAKKLGKSWLSLQLCRTVAEGSAFLTFGAARCAPVVYLALEDGQRRLKARLLKQGGISGGGGKQLYFLTEFERLDKGGLKAIETLHNEKGFGLIVIDVWQRFAPPCGKRDAYEHVYHWLGELKGLADRLGFFCLCVTHTRKGQGSLEIGDETDVLDEIQGSGAVAGVADVAIVLRRKRMAQAVRMFVTSRDFPEGSHLLTFIPETCAFEPSGDAAGLNDMNAIDRAAKFLFQELANGAVLVAELENHAGALVPPISKSSLDRAARDFDIIKAMQTDRRWTWRLPERRDDKNHDFLNC